MDKNFVIENGKSINVTPPCSRHRGCMGSILGVASVWWESGVQANNIAEGQIRGAGLKLIGQWKLTDYQR
ncbi:hypothetical protein MANES_16G089150v8 [Manihot esculenta]|uniref:Uncharacterized protein n=1 Tax=Manihot esculenta TaxID=3983 RepID=A0ACB7GB91_MANES|nr:hypothetical protein MANES_16G089150v8 [Manihot esculenta]